MLQTVLLLMLSGWLSGCGSGISAGDSLNLQADEGNPVAGSDLTSPAQTTPDSVTAPLPAGFIPDVSQFESELQRDPALADISGVDAGFYTSGNASHIVTGPVVGKGAVANSEAVRVLPFQIGDETSRVKLEQVYATRVESARFTDVGAIAIVHNTGSRTRCFVSVTYPQLVNTANKLVNERFGNSAYAAGTNSGPSPSVYNTDGNSPGRTCVPADERAYISMRFRDIALQDVRGISIEEVSSLNPLGGTTYPLQALVPLQYELLNAGELMRISVQNQSPDNVNMTGGDYIFLDAAGFPLFAASSSRGVSDAADGVMQPGETRTEDVIVSGFQGQASTVRAIFSFERLQ